MENRCDNGIENKKADSQFLHRIQNQPFRLYGTLAHMKRSFIFDQFVLGAGVMIFAFAVPLAGCCAVVVA